MKHFRYLWVFFFCCFVKYQTSYGQADTIKVGIFVTNLYDFNIGEGQFITDFWTWALYKNKEFNFQDAQEVPMSKSAVFNNYYSETRGDLIWTQKKCTAKVIHDWDVKKFPFDKQVLKIRMEDAQKDTSDIIYTADVANSKVDQNLTLEEWNIDTMILKEFNNVYNTSYGDPDLPDGESVYPSVIASIYLTRLHSWNIFIKLVTGVYVAFMIALLAFKILPPDSESRIGLAVGGLFSAVGNKYIVESIVPSSSQTTLIDHIHNITFAFILIIVVCIIYITRLYFIQDYTKATKWDKWSFRISLWAYIAINVVITGLAFLHK